MYLLAQDTETAFCCRSGAEPDSRLSLLPHGTYGKGHPSSHACMSLGLSTPLPPPALRGFHPGFGYGSACVQQPKCLCTCILGGCWQEGLRHALGVVELGGGAAGRGLGPSVWA